MTPNVLTETWCLLLKLIVCQVIEAADVVIEVLDARDPLGSRCTQVEEAVLECGTQKRLILLLNKIGECCSVL